MMATLTGRGKEAFEIFGLGLGLAEDGIEFGELVTRPNPSGNVRSEARAVHPHSIFG